jgi:hypothetical protein
MATTKKALAKVQKSDNVLDVMSNAGIDIKLTKTEIADYIAEKAQEELNTEIARVADQINDLRAKTYPVTGKWKVLADAYNAILPAHEQVPFVLTYSHGGYHSVSDKRRYYCGMNHTYHRYLQIEIDEADMPKELLALPELEKHIGELQQRLNQLRTKKHRILLIEKILSGTDSGKVVLSDLTKIVNKMVKE